MANTIDFNVGTNAVTVLNQTADAAANTAQQFTSAKAELRALTQQMLQLDASSAEFKKASARASELKDRMEELGENVRVNIGNSFEQASNSVSLFTGRLMGGDLKGAGDALTNLGGAVSKISFKEIQEEIGGLIKGLGKLAKAVLTNPYLMLAAAIALIVANFDTIIKQFPAIEKGLTGINEQERELLDLQTKRAEQAKKNYDNISAMENTLKLQGKTEKEIRDMKIAAIQAAIQEAKVRLETQRGQEKAQIETAQRNREILEGVIRWINAPLYLLLATVDKIASWVGQTTNLAEGLTNLAADLLIDPEQQQADLQKSFEEQENTIRDMQNSLDGFVNEQKEKDKDAAEKTRKEREDAQKEADAAELERRKKLNEEMMAEDDRMQSIGTDDLIARQKERGDKQLLTEMQIHANLTALRADQSKADIEELRKAEDAKAQLRVDAMKTSLSIISDLAQAFAGDSERQQKKAFQIQKGVSIATATIDTYLAAQGAYRSQMAISTPDAPVRAAVAAGIAIAQGLARVAIISKQQFNGGGGTSGGSGSGSVPQAGGLNSPSPANFAFVGNQPNQQQPPLQAYVVGTQVSSNLEAQQLIQNQSRLGG
jgi:hypothetical protein